MANIDTGRKTVTTAGTRVALAAVEQEVRSVAITALEGNTGKVVVGGANVVAALATRQGTPLGPSESLVLYSLNLQEIFLDSMVSGEGVSFTWLGR